MWGLNWDNGKENGNYRDGRGYIRVKLGLYCVNNEQSNGNKMETGYTKVTTSASRECRSGKSDGTTMQLGAT